MLDICFVFHNLIAGCIHLSLSLSLTHARSLSTKVSQSWLSTRGCHDQRRQDYRGRRRGSSGDGRRRVVRREHGEVGADECGAHAVALAHRRLELGPVAVGAENVMEGSIMMEEGRVSEDK